LLSPLYAEIVIDLQARDLKDRLFTYKVPEFLLDEVFVGAQVLVPFGHQDTVGGYVVALKNSVDAEFKIKDIAEVLEPDPLFDKDYIDFLGWLAFRSCARLSDVVQAAIPASLAPRIKRVVRIAARLSKEDVEKMKSVLTEKNASAATLLNVLTSSGAKGVSVTTLRQRFGRVARKGHAHFFQALTFLKREEVVEIVAETAARTGPKTVSNVVRGQQEPKTARQKEITALLERNNGTMNLTDLLKTARTTYGTIHKLEADGVIQLQETEVFRNPMDGYTSTKRNVPPKPSLTKAQEHVVGVLSEDLKRTMSRQVSDEDKEESPWLLHGVTGSGKTEVYLRLIEEALAAKRTALLLVPEISLTPQLASRLKDRFGDSVSIWHSAISPGERYDTWRRLRSGDVSVLLGARSAILAHVPNLGLIILDEEHDSSYKQSTPSPRYNAKEVAIEKARRNGALVLFGSATPDVATYHRAHQANKILELPERVHSQAMPEVKIIDMREQLSLGNRSILSTALSHAIEKRLDVGEQVILLMNRRGYASHVFCRACGFVVRCNNCSVSLVFHKSARTTLIAGRAKPEGAQDGYLSCHHCGYERHSIITCPSCKSPFIKEYGLGTQQVEETVRNRFPGARTLRLDSDVTQKKGAYREIFEDFAAGEADVLIGTQMVAKGLDIANVTLVGVLVADASLNMPDYRSMERGFQLLCQVSGRAGRGLKPGQVILQTYNPDLKVFKYARKHDYASFFKTELEAREAFSYPPYSRIIRVVLQGPDPQDVETGLERLAEELSVFVEDKATEPALQILGPSPCVIEKVKNRFRFHLLMKVKDDENVMDSILHFLRNKKVPKELSLAVDVDALDLL
jgi:primosomal protein N' (replication factor Y)